MEQKILEKIDACKDQMLEDIRSLVKIDSVETAAAPGAPFGPGVQRLSKKLWKQESGWAFAP